MYLKIYSKSINILHYSRALMPRQLSQEEQRINGIIIAVMMAIAAAIIISRQLFSFFLGGSILLFVILIIVAIIEIFVRHDSYFGNETYLSKYI